MTMPDSNPIQDLLREEPDLDLHLRKQRERIVQAVRRHEFRHKWIVRTFTTFFWTSAVVALLMAGVLHNPELVASGTVWLLLGAIVLLQSRLRHLELKIDEVRALLGNREEGAENEAKPPPPGHV
jgi:hypothetical protein